MLKYADVLFTGFTRVTCAGSDVVGPLGSFALAFGLEARDALVVRVVFLTGVCQYLYCCTRVREPSVFACFTSR